jgi:hypothetical protein
MNERPWELVWWWQFKDPTDASTGTTLKTIKWWGQGMAYFKNVV